MNRFSWIAMGVVVLSVLLWLSPSMMRNPAVPFPGVVSYDDAHLAAQWHGGLLIRDSQSGELRLLNPLHILLAAVDGGTLQMLRVVGIVSAIAGALGVWLLLRRSRIPLRTAVLALLLYCTSTVTAYLAAAPNSTGVIVALTFLAAGLVVQDGVIWRILGALCAVEVAISGPMAALHLAIIMVGVLLWQKRLKETVFYVLVPVAAGAVIWWPMLSQQSFQWVTPFVGVLAEFGARPGIGVMELFVAFIGLGIIWSQTERHISLLAATIYAGVSAVASAYAAPLWSMLAAVCIMSLYERQWRYSFLKTISLFAIGCGLLLSVLALNASMRQDEPTQALVQGIQTLGPAKVVTDPLNEDWIQYWSPASLVVGTHGAPVDLAPLWYTRDLQNATRILDGLGADTIVVTKAMREGGIWSADDEGFLFLLERSEMFKKGFSNSEIQVYSRVRNTQ